MKKILLLLAFMASVVTVNAGNLEPVRLYEYMYGCGDGRVITMVTNRELTVSQIEAWYAYAETVCAGI